MVAHWLSVPGEVQILVGEKKFPLSFLTFYLMIAIYPRIHHYNQMDQHLLHIKFLQIWQFKKYNNARLILTWEGGQKESHKRDHIKHSLILSEFLAFQQSSKDCQTQIFQCVEQFSTKPTQLYHYLLSLKLFLATLWKILFTWTT